MDVIAGLQRLFAEIASKAPKSSVATMVSATITTVSPLTVTLDSDVTATPREADAAWVGPLAVGQPVRCELLGSDLTVVAAPAGLVPWSIPGRRIVVGPDGDQEPSVVIKRDRPNYSGTAYMYLAGSVNSTEFAVAVQDGGVTQATLRLDRDNIRHQDAVGGRGTRYVAFRDEIPSLTSLNDRLTALEKVKTAMGSVSVTVSASAGGTASVTFPTGRFTASDTLFAQVSRASGALAKYVPYVINVTRTGMTVGLYSGDGTAATGTVPVHWRVEAA